MRAPKKRRLYLVLACGIFGNIVDEDIERTIDACTRLCRTGGTVIQRAHCQDHARI